MSSDLEYYKDITLHSNDEMSKIIREITYNPKLQPSGYGYAIEVSEINTDFFEKNPNIKKGWITDTPIYWKISAGKLYIWLD